MSKVGIVIDAWKLTILKRRLQQGGFTYQESPGVTVDTILMTVETNDVPRLVDVIKKSHTESQNVKQKDK